MANRARLFVSIVVGGVLLGLLFTASSHAQPGAMLKIVTVRGTPSSTGYEHTDYILPDRRRQEFEFPVPGGERNATITRCDRDSYISLAISRRSYFGAPLATVRRARAQSSRSLPRMPPVLVEISTVDTGERRTSFGYAARRVITTQKERVADPIPRLNEMRKDGWYIDLNAHISCSEEAFVGESYDAIGVLTSDWFFGSHEPVFTYVGARETGYPVEEHRTYNQAVRTLDGSIRQHTSTWSIRVTSLSFEPVDPALFEVPLDFYVWTEVRHAWDWIQRRLAGF